MGQLWVAVCFGGRIWGEGELFLLILGWGMAVQRIKVKLCYNEVNNYSYDTYSLRCTSVLSPATDLHHIQFIRVQGYKTHHEVV